MRRGKMLLFVACLGLAVTSIGCSKSSERKVTEIEIVQYKPEAASYFKSLEKKFNDTHNDIHLTINSPNDATTILKTRFIREDYPDIIGIGGDINYSYYVDAGILADLSDYDGIKTVKKSYMDISESLEIVPTDGTYALPYVANAAGILYNRDMFEKHHWKIPNSWEELTALCDQMQKEGIQPFYFGFKDTWTCLAPWNSIAVDLTPADTAKQVNSGTTTFSKEYREVSEKYLKLLEYGQKDPFSYGYNDACTAFANGESAMYTIGSYAISQILSVNPDMNIDSFVMPAGEDNKLNSGIDLAFCVTEACENKEAAYEVLDFLYEDENLENYINNQISIPCKEGKFKISSALDGMKEYIDAGKTADFQDHYYPAEMAVDAQIQTFLIHKNVEEFLEKFDKDWQRYNRDIIREVQKYEQENRNK